MSEFAFSQSYTLTDDNKDTITMQRVFNDEVFITLGRNDAATFISVKFKFDELLKVVELLKVDKS